MTNPINYALNKVIHEELSQRNDIKQKAIDIILSRCELCDGRLRQGSLLKYVYDKLGLKGLFGKYYREYMIKLIEDLGCRRTDFGGAAIFSGICWKGEDKRDWRYPKSADIPCYNKSINDWQYGQRQDRIHLEERVLLLEQEVEKLKAICSSLTCSSNAY